MKLTRMRGRGLCSAMSTDGVIVITEASSPWSPIWTTAAALRP